MQKFKDKTNFVSKEGIMCILFKNIPNDNSKTHDIYSEKRTVKEDKRSLSEFSLKTNNKKELFFPKINKTHNYEGNLKGIQKKIEMNKNNKLKIIR